MIIDCDGCVARPYACGDCVVGVLLGMPAAAAVELDGAEQAAIGVLAASGLVPPLRLVDPVPGPVVAPAPAPGPGAVPTYDDTHGGGARAG